MRESNKASLPIIRMMEGLALFGIGITHLLLLNDSDMLMKIMTLKGWSLSMKTVTVYDIAREAGVSVATVSRVLNNTAPVKASTRERIVKLINKYQFQPNALARSLIKKVTGMIALFCRILRIRFSRRCLLDLSRRRE